MGAVGRKSSDNGWTVVELLASAEHTVEANALGASVKLPDVQRMLVLLDVTASATIAGDTLDVFLDVSWDNGANWLNAIHFTQVAGNASPIQFLAALSSEVNATDPDADLNITGDASAGVVRQPLLGPLVRVRSTVVRDTGTDEAHTFEVTAYVQ